MTLDLGTTFDSKSLQAESQYQLIVCLFFFPPFIPPSLYDSFSLESAEYQANYGPHRHRDSIPRHRFSSLGTKYSRGKSRR